MESSTVLAFRIFVMLSCLIIVPMAAIFGSAFPDVVKTVLVDRIVALSTGKPPEPAAAPADPQGFREVTPNVAQGAPANSGAAPSWGAQAATASWQAPGAAAAPAAVVPLGGPPQGEGFNQSASFAAPAAAAQPGEARPPMPPSGAFPGAGAPPHVPTAHIMSVATQAASCGTDRTACPLEQPDRFTEIERKLREYGATYYLLETYGNQGELYRFHCRMAVAGGNQYPRMFEATDPDALKAMADVLHRVEAWRGGQIQ